MGNLQKLPTRDENDAKIEGWKGPKAAEAAIEAARRRASKARRSA